MKIIDLDADLTELFSLQPRSKKINETEIENRPDVQLAEPELIDQSDQDTMIPPLQQKIELLKKAVDVDSFYDDADKSTVKNGDLHLTINIPAGQSNTKIDLTVNGQKYDELDQIKKLAGVPVATIFDAGDDEPLDS